MLAKIITRIRARLRKATHSPTLDARDLLLEDMKRLQERIEKLAEVAEKVTRHETSS